MKDMDVCYLTSSAHYQLNGLAGKYVQLIKNYLAKARETDENAHFAMMAYRNTPLGNGLQPPMEILYARQARLHL